MTPKLLLRWMGDQRGYPVLKVYRIERNRFGVLVYRIVESVVIGWGQPHRHDLDDQSRYGPGSYCAHNRPACIVDMRRSAGLDRDTPDGVVIDWWDENVPVTGDQWRASEKRKAKAARG